MGRREPNSGGSVPVRRLSSTGPTAILYYSKEPHRTGRATALRAQARGRLRLLIHLRGTGSGTYLDKVELLSGPVLSDLEQGCEVNQKRPRGASITVCPTTETASPRRHPAVVHNARVYRWLRGGPRYVMDGRLRRTHPYQPN